MCVLGDIIKWLFQPSLLERLHKLLESMSGVIYSICVFYRKSTIISQWPKKIDCVQCSGPIDEVSK